MPSLHENLTALNRRLQCISLLPANQDDPIEVNELDVDIIKLKYICAECAWTTSTNAQALARHFIFQHTIRLQCPHCSIRCMSQEHLDKHQSQKHKHLCPACQTFFATVNECKHHEPCESQYASALSPTISSAMESHQLVNEKAPSNAKRRLGKRGSVQSGSCPDPGCQLTFLDFDHLYEHYVGSHPLSIVCHGLPKPFKCPFCSKRYQHDRFVRGHVRTHKPKFSVVTGTGDAEDQESLIQQSRLTMANRESKAHAEAQAQAGSNSVDIEEEGHYSLFFKDGLIYIDEGLEVESPILEQSIQINRQESQPSWETTPVGLVLQARPTDSPILHPANEKSPVEKTLPYPTTEPELSDTMDLDDDYPERFALDDDELPFEMSNRNSSIIVSEVFDAIFHQSLSSEIIRTLGMRHFVDLSEVVELVAYFLDGYQRMYVMKQLGSINLDQHDSDVLSALGCTALKDLIDAWVHFKRLAIHFAPQLVRQAAEQGISSGKSFTLALVQYCLKLENIIYRNEKHIAHTFLRDPPANEFVLFTDASFPRLIAALAERIKNRVVHDSSIVFTNDMVLKGMKDYVKILQMIFKQLFPISAGHERLWKELRLL